MHRRSQSQKSIQQKALSKTLGSPEQDFEDPFEPVKPISNTVITLSALAKKLIDYKHGFDLYFRNNLLKITDVLNQKKVYPKYIAEHSLSFIKMLNYASAQFIQLQDFEASMKVLDLALRLSQAGQETSENLIQQLVVINNLAVLSQKIGKYSVSKSYLKFAISKINHISVEAKRSEELNVVEVITMNNLCHQYMKEEKHEKVFNLSDRALQIIEPQMFQRLQEESEDVLKGDVKFISNLQLLLQAYIYRAWSLNEIQNTVYYLQKQQQLSLSSLTVTDTPQSDRMRIYKNGYKLSRILLGKEDKSTKRFQSLLQKEQQSIDGKKPFKIGGFDLENNQNKPAQLKTYYDIFSQDYLNLEVFLKLHVLKYTLEQQNIQVEGDTLQLIDSQEDVGEQDQTEERKLADNDLFFQQQPQNVSSQIPFFSPPFSRKTSSNNRIPNLKQSKQNQQSKQSQILSKSQIQSGQLSNIKGRAYSQFNPRESSYSQAELSQQNVQYNQQFQMMLPSLQQAQVKGTNGIIVNNNANRNFMINKIPQNLIELPFYQQQKQTLALPERTEQLSPQIQQQIPVLSPQSGMVSTKSRFFNHGIKPLDDNNQIDSLSLGVMQQQQKYFFNNFMNADPSQQQYLNQNDPRQQQQMLQQQSLSFGRGNVLLQNQKNGLMINQHSNQGQGNQEIISTGQDYSAFKYPGGGGMQSGFSGENDDENSKQTTTQLNNNIQKTIINPSSQYYQQQIINQQMQNLMNHPEVIQTAGGVQYDSQHQIQKNTKVNQKQFESQGNEQKITINSMQEQFVAGQNQMQGTNKIITNGVVNINPVDQSYVANLLEDTLKIDNQEQQPNKTSGQLLKNILQAQFNEASKYNTHDESLIIPREIDSEHGSNNKQFNNNNNAAINNNNLEKTQAITQFTAKKQENINQDSNYENNSVEKRTEQSNAKITNKDINQVKIPLHLIEDKNGEAQNSDSDKNRRDQKVISPKDSQEAKKEQSVLKIAQQKAGNTTNTNQTYKMTLTGAVTPEGTAISSNQVEETTRSNRQGARNSNKEQPTKDIVSLKNIPAGMLGLSPVNYKDQNDNNTPQTGSAQQGHKKPEESSHNLLTSPSNQTNQKQRSHKEFDNGQSTKHPQEQQEFQTQQSQQQTQLSQNGQRGGQNNHKSKDEATGIDSNLSKNTILRVNNPGNTPTTTTSGKSSAGMKLQYKSNSKPKLPSINTISQSTFPNVQSAPSMNKLSKFDEEETTPHGISKQNTHQHLSHHPNHHPQTQPPSSVVMETNFDYLSHITPEIISNVDYSIRKRIIFNSIVYQVEINVNKLQSEPIIELSGYSVLERKILPVESLTFKVLQKRKDY